VTVDFVLHLVGGATPDHGGEAKAQHSGKLEAGLHGISSMAHGKKCAQSLRDAADECTPCATRRNSEPLMKRSFGRGDSAAWRLVSMSR
jgi:hypothetical protein